MSDYIGIISGYLDTHYSESASGLVDKSPSKLARGEGTEKSFFIMKIDLVNSTKLLMGRRQATYLKLAHTFLSTLDRIVQDFGADGSQTEYAGDSILAYFPSVNVDAQNVLAAACYCREAVNKIKTLDATLGSLDLKSKIVLHHAPLVVSRIGPRADSVLTAIGHPLHVVAKLEKTVPENGGRATTAFFKELKHDSKKFLNPLYSERRQLSDLLGIRASGVASNVQPPPQSLASILRGIDTGLSRRVGLGDAIGAVPRGVEPQPLRVAEGYSVSWSLLYRHHRIPIR